MKKNKGSGKSIISGARKTAEIVWALLTAKTEFDSAKMTGIYKPMDLLIDFLWEQKNISIV